jgi:hypothetical protein
MRRTMCGGKVSVKFEVYGQCKYNLAVYACTSTAKYITCQLTFALTELTSPISCLLLRVRY